jgi:phosphatidylglycerol:prolipoprotein diacylglycerol transferase
MPAAIEHASDALPAHGFVHNIDPVFLQIGRAQLCYYGLAYAIGFLGIFVWLRWRQQRMGWSTAEVYDFSLLFAASVLLFGRFFSIVVYHWGYYWQHPNEVFSFWRGGMATHGVLLGGLVTMVFFCWWRRKSFLQLADEVVIPAALLMAIGRVGNFINGQIVGTPTDVWWAVEFPGAEGFRHPVTLYEALKNLLLIPILLVVRHAWGHRRGMVAAHFVFWYGFLRIFADVFRDHGAEFLGIGRNQYFNLLMAMIGIGMMWVFSRRGRRESAGPTVGKVVQPADQLQPAGAVRSVPERPLAFWFRRIALGLILLFSLIVRGAWTPEVLHERRAEKAVATIPPGSVPRD